MATDRFTSLHCLGQFSMNVFIVLVHSWEVHHLTQSNDAGPAQGDPPAGPAVAHVQRCVLAEEVLTRESIDVAVESISVRTH